MVNGHKRRADRVAEKVEDPDLESIDRGTNTPYCRLRTVFDQQHLYDGPQRVTGEGPDVQWTHDREGSRPATHLDKVVATLNECGARYGEEATRRALDVLLAEREQGIFPPYGINARRQDWARSIPLGEAMERDSRPRSKT